MMWGIEYLDGSTLGCRARSLRSGLNHARSAFFVYHSRFSSDDGSFSHRAHCFGRYLLCWLAIKRSFVLALFIDLAGCFRFYWRASIYEDGRNDGGAGRRDRYYR